MINMSNFDSSLSSTSKKKIQFSQQQTPKNINKNNKIEELLNYDSCEMNSEESIQSKKGKDPSLFSFLRVELTREYVLEHDEERYSARREKVYSFMKIPREVEKFMTYGFLQCTESFLFVYTFLPMRVILALWALMTRPVKKCFGLQTKIKNPSMLSPAEICDLLKATIILSCSMLMYYIDTNMMYHLIKSQSVIKLYIFYNILEVGDRLFSAFGQDTIDALFWTATEPRDRRREHLGVIPHLFFAVIYVFLHSILVLFQATCLNVAINSNNKALLTVMMSNNFVELKGSVFKKFDKNNLFQVSCSDVRERFHLVVLLFIVVIQTMKEYAWKVERLWVLIPDCIMVLLAEVLVDWIKHAFITRFNELQVDVYRDYTISLAYDVAQTRQKHAFSDYSDLVARRMGFIPLPLGVVMIRVLTQAVHLSNVFSVLLSCLAYLCVCTFKVLNSIIILGCACLLIAQHRQEKATVNSPLHNRSNCPLTPSNNNGNSKIPKELFKDGVAENVIVSEPTTNVNGLNLKEGKCIRIIEPVTTPNDLGSAAIFSNSTVDLKNASLNEELLNVDDSKLEPTVDKTRSVPNINCDFKEDPVESNSTNNVETAMKKRAESEPNLVNCNEIEDA